MLKKQHITVVLPDASVQWPRVSKTESLSSGSRCGLVNTVKRWETTPYCARPDAREATKKKVATGEVNTLNC